MATLTVKQNGTGNYTTIGAALANIGYSVLGAGADDIVEIQDSATYTEGIVNNLPSGTSWTHPFTLRAATGQTPTIKFSGQSNLLVFLPISASFYAIIQGIKFDGTNCSGSQVTLSASTSGPSAIRLLNCEWVNTENENAIFVGGYANDIQLIGGSIHGGLFFTLSNAAQRCHGVYWSGSGGLIDGTLMYDITGYGVHMYGESGPLPSNNTVRNTIVHTVATDTHVAAGILMASGSSNLAHNNTVYDIPAKDLDGGVGIAVGGTSNSVFNNTVYNCSYMGLDLSGSTNAVVRNNIAYLNGTNIETGGSSGLTQSNNFTSNPLFVNVGTGDFHLQASSTAINFGIDVGLPYSGSAPDAGAFEFSAPVVPPTAPTHQYNNSTKFYELLLADSSVVSSSGVHCLQPVNGPNGFVTFVKAGNAAQTVARKISTGAEYINSEQTAGMGGGYNRWANDGSRYIIGARRVTHGKQFFYRDLVAYIFDTQAPEKWLNFATLGRPTLDIFRAVGAGQKPLALWVKNGNQVTGFENSDPLGIIRRFTFISATLIDFVLEQRIGDNDANITAAFVRCQRTFTLATGAMSAISTVATHTVNAASPTAPAWLYVAT